ncbi:MAG: GNAT family N-acetyltransferase [Gemmatimonadetes bacterium]|nr:GNAT family N-acetyltransferase [Gemmatimonadota bacterium]
MAIRIRRFATAQHFLRRAEPWLLRAEAANNLVLSVAYAVARGELEPAGDAYFATVEHDGKVAGCAFRTPPHKLALTRMPLGAAPALADDVAAAYDAVPGVLGPEPEALRFADEWGPPRGLRARRGMRQRIYRLHALTPPAAVPPGRARAAAASDLPTLGRWFAAFAEEARVPVPHAEDVAARYLESGDLFVWEHDGPASMAARVGRTPNGVRVAFVYTPPERRGRGYATALVADVTARILAAGYRFAFLFTDLGNPTSNRIYTALGYRPVCDVVDVELVAPEEVVRPAGAGAGS